MAGKRVLVTGAAGFIGSHTVDRLITEGHEVLGIDNLSTGAETNLDQTLASPRFSLERADITESGVFDSSVAQFCPDAIIHLAALVSVPRSESDPKLNYRLNVGATHEVCEAARNRGVKRIVFASSAAVYGECSELPLSESTPAKPISQYGYAKRISEQILASYDDSYGISTVSFRYFNVYGPRQDPESPYSGVVSIFSDRFREGKAVIVNGDGSQSRDFVYVGDVAKANTIAATTERPVSGIFNCATGVSTTLLDLIAALKDHYPGADAPEHRDDRAGDIKHSLGEASAIKEAFGFVPETPFPLGLKSLLDA